MNIDNILLNLWKSEEKNILITDEDGKVVYESKVMECPVKLFLNRLDFAPEDDDEWELLDKAKDSYFRVKRTVIAEDGKNYTCYSFTDVSEYTRLMKDVLSYTKGITRESWHDKLTGLYNKGKYMALKREKFGNPKSIAIYNFDVNNLKYINDNFGHEMGDKLIIMAANSIKAVCGGNVLGFRMGGDEYMMIAKDLSREEADALLKNWRAELDRLNEADETFRCVMPCGMVYGSGDYDYDALFAQADDLMYDEKRRLKAEGFVTELKRKV